ncbi:hypothetical protein J3D60_000143 [Pseudomonas sp. S3E17]|nr:hypothetical protein [Pseudomonas sp. S3E17]
MPHQKIVQRALQYRQTECLTAQANGRRNIVLGTAGFVAIEEPQPLLTKGQNSRKHPLLIRHSWDCPCAVETLQQIDQCPLAGHDQLPHRLGHGIAWRLHLELASRGECEPYIGGFKHTQDIQRRTVRAV